MQPKKATFSVLLALVLASVGFGRPPTPDIALQYAKEVVFVKRVLVNEEIRSYVKEVWRFDPKAGPPPAVGSEFGRRLPYDPRMQHPERDGIEFTFGADRPAGLTPRWGIQVLEDGMVLPFNATVGKVRSKVEATTH